LFKTTPTTSYELMLGTNLKFLMLVMLKSCMLVVLMHFISWN